MSNRDPELPFEAFIKRQNNFYLHFLDCFIGGIYRESEEGSYARCKAEHPELDKELRPDLERLYRGVGGFQNPEFQEKLYEAYKLMRPYAEKDWDMFA